MHVEFRRQTYSWSLAELALTIGLVEVGGLWTDARLGRRPGRAPGGPELLAAQGRLQPRDWRCSTARSPSPSSTPCRRPRSPSRCAGSADPRRARRRPRRRAAWSPSRSSAPPAIRARSSGASSSCPSPSSPRWSCRSAIIALLLSSLSSWAWVLVAPRADRRRPALPALRQGGARGQQRRAGLRLRPPRRAGLPRRGRHPADRRGGPRAAQRRAGGPLAAALPRRGTAPGRLRRERRGLVRRPGRPRRRLPPARASARPTGPLLVSLARADDDEAAALGRRGVSDLLGRPGHRRRRGSPATSRSATAAATSSPSPTATAPRWTRCSPTSTPRSGSSSCSPRSATTPTTTG